MNLIYQCYVTNSGSVSNAADEVYEAVAYKYNTEIRIYLDNITIQTPCQKYKYTKKKSFIH